MNNNRSGKYAEFLARTLFRLKGYSIIYKNYITGKGTNAGEIDFIAKRRKTIVFVEVKKRKTIEDAAYSISENQKERIVKGAEAFIRNHKQYTGYDYRFDAVLVQFPFNIKHIKDAWNK